MCSRMQATPCLSSTATPTTNTQRIQKRRGQYGAVVADVSKTFDAPARAIHLKTKSHNPRHMIQTAIHSLNLS